MQRPDGKMHNLLSYDRRFMDDVGSEDCIGRTLWACGYSLDSNLPTEKRFLAKEIFDKACPSIPLFKSPRAIAFAILGMSHYQKAFKKDQNPTRNITMLAGKLLENYKNESSSHWRWFEPYITYVNGRLPQALFEAYVHTEDEDCLRVAKESVDFLIGVQMINGVFTPIGNHGWYNKGKRRALYDQQSVEASCMVEAATTAFRVTGNRSYKKLAKVIFDWFLGKNSQSLAVYNQKTGGCRDGLTSRGLNLNEGAEATISYLAARLELEALKGNRPS